MDKDCRIQTLKKLLGETGSIDHMIRAQAFFGAMKAKDQAEFIVNLANDSNNLTDVTTLFTGLNDGIKQRQIISCLKPKLTELEEGSDQKGKLTNLIGKLEERVSTSLKANLQEKSKWIAEKFGINVKTNPNHLEGNENAGEDDTNGMDSMSGLSRNISNT